MEDARLSSGVLREVIAHRSLRRRGQNTTLLSILDHKTYLESTFEMLAPFDYYTCRSRRALEIALHNVYLSVLVYLTYGEYTI